MASGDREPERGRKRTGDPPAAMVSPSVRSPRVPNPPTPLTGDPPAAVHPTSPLAGDPPAAVHPTSPLAGDPPAATRSAPLRSVSAERTSEGRSLLHRGEALDLQSCSSGSSASCPIEEIPRLIDLQKRADSRGKGTALDPIEETSRSQLRQEASDRVRNHASYKDALLGVKTFRPRFDNTCAPEEWRVNKARPRSDRSVWGRLGPRQSSVHDRLGARGPQRAPGIDGFLQLLKARAVGRCFNCFASDHRIAECRDPPRCVLCSRSGHKARSCPVPASSRRVSTAPAPIWRRRGSAAGASEPAPAPVSTPTTKKTDAAPSSSRPPLMDFIPGDPDRRPSRVTACAARTAAIREAERDLLLHCLTAVQRDARVQLSCDVVFRDALHQLRIPAHMLRVSRISAASFLLRFETPEMRNAARERGSLSVGRTSLHLMPWGRQAGASVTRLSYRMRVCLEGVPDHAHQVDSVLHLLPKQSFVEEVDYVRETEDEKACFILWLWCNDPDALAVQGTLKIEEPIELPESCWYSGDGSQMPVGRSEELTMFEYNVLLHLDRVEDYSPLPNSSSIGSYESDTSGIPSDEPMRQWPVRHSFVWHLGQPDALPDPPRGSVHSRLGGRRDRSPPRGGGSGGGSRQMPPPNHFDMARYGHGAGSSVQKIYGGAGGGYNGHQRGTPDVQKVEEQLQERKKSECKRSVADVGMMFSGGGQKGDLAMEAATPERSVGALGVFDPMVEEAEQLCHLANGTSKSL